jgi:perosamine synthetase
MARLDIGTILEALRSVIPEKQGPISLHEPFFGGNEWAYLKDCLDSTWVSYVGPYVDRFEAMLAKFVGVRKAVAVVNGTEALHLALKLVGVGPGDEVLVPALTFVATANAVAYCGAMPHFVDSEEKTLGLDPSKLKAYLREVAMIEGRGCINRQTGRPMRAVVPMHTFGHPVDLDPLVEICEEYGLAMVEDAAESLGSYYKGRHTGQWGKLSILSFNGNKTVTTGGGGAILTNDEELAALAKHLTSTAKVPHRWAFRHDHVGYNLRLPNINAALGCAQMEQLPAFLEQKRRLAVRYAEAFHDVSGVRFFTEPSFARSNYWLNVLLLEAPLADQRDAVLDATNDEGFKTRPAWDLLNTLAIYESAPKMDLSCAENLARRIVNLPSSVFLGKADEA